MKKVLSLIRANVDGQDVLFYGGLALLIYGIQLRSISAACVVAGAILIVHSYMPAVADVIRGSKKQ